MSGFRLRAPGFRPEVWGPKRLLFSVLASTFIATALAAQTGSRVIVLSFEDARPVLQALAPILPSDLKSQDVNALAASWPEWVNKNNAETRARLERGDEDSLVNLLLFGTSFTEQPR